MVARSFGGGKGGGFSLRAFLAIRGIHQGSGEAGYKTGLPIVSLHRELRHKWL
jgi:hypothetical protein